MKKILIILMIINLTAIFAGDASRKGTAGADQLLVPVGARSIATGGAFVANVRGIESIYYNPAGLNSGGYSEAMFSYMSYIADINVSYLAVSASLGDLGALGLSIKTFDFGDIPVTTITSPDGTGSTYSPAFYTMGLTYSKIITDRVSVGVNFNLIHEGIMNTAANGFGLDFGVQYSFSNNLHLGVAVKNIGSNMSYSGQELQVKTEIPDSYPGSALAAYEPATAEFQIPSYFEMSVAYSMDIDEANNLGIASTFRNNNNLEDLVKVGLEYGFSDTFFLRGGYNLITENTADSAFDLTFGGGIYYNFSSDLGVQFDYAYRNVKNFPVANHIFTLILSVQ